MNEIEKDICKLKEIKEEVEGDYPCFLIILDKKIDISQYIPRGDNGLTIYYINMLMIQCDKTC
ncbi:MAG TPA: hypothetical protein PLO36_06960 [Methanofastidiosum sp.]|nr:hypothetical protein [Methanofastidiosum sp.]